MRSHHWNVSSRLLFPLLLSTLLLAALAAAGLGYPWQGNSVQDAPSPSTASAVPPSTPIVTADPADPRRYAVASNIQSTRIVDYFVDPTAKVLTIPQLIERSTTLPGIKGVLRGVVTGGPTTQATSSWGIVDFPFSVQGFLGPVASPYPVGVPITLRIVDLTADVNTGQTGQTFGVTAGDELFVYVRNQGGIGGGNTGTVLVASQPYDILTLRDGIVYGNGAWASYAEPLATFEKHFVH